MQINTLQVIMSDKPNNTMSKYSALSQSQAVRLLMAGVLGGSMLGLAGMTLTATMMGLVVATPGLVLMAPILVPAAAVLSLVTSGFVFSGSCLLGALGVTGWMYRYMAGKRLFGAHKLDYARMKIVSKVRGVKEGAKEMNEHKTEEPVLQGS